MVVLREQVAVSIRDQKVTAIIPLADFAYNDVPVINGRGFAVHVTSAADVDAFKKELSAEGAVRSLRTSLISGLILRLTAASYLRMSTGQNNHFIMRMESCWF